jgi:hypothetical protein
MTPSITAAISTAFPSAFPSARRTLAWITAFAVTTATEIPLFSACEIARPVERSSFSRRSIERSALTRPVEGRSLARPRFFLSLAHRSLSLEQPERSCRDLDSIISLEQGLEREQLSRCNA